MNNIKVITLEQSQEWDQIIRSFQNYDVYYLSGYVKAFAINGDGIPLLFYYEDKNNRAINVVLKRDVAEVSLLSKYIKKNEYFDFTTPYGYGGYLIEGNDVESLNHEYSDYCIKNNIICEFVRYHPLLENWKGFENMYDQSHLGDTVYIDTCNEETIWHNISSKNRNTIRKAIKNGLKTFWCRDPKIIQPFMELYNKTMDKDEANSYYYFDYEFYESILYDLKDNAMWFYTMKDQTIAAISIIMFCNGKVHYHLSATNRMMMNLAPTNLLLYDVAKWACHNGFKKMHLGGGVGSNHDNLYKFKKAFNRLNDKEFWIGKKIFNENVYKKCVDMSFKNDIKSITSYFPRYRDV